MTMHHVAPAVVAGRSATPVAGPFSSESVFGSLLPELQRSVKSEGYTDPTPIQEQCIPHLLSGRDILGCAQTGTGKTAAFALPLLQRLGLASYRPKRGTPKALILAPTRELAAQIGDSIRTYGRHLRIRHAVVFGGVSQFHQVQLLNNGIDILIATPGRLLDLMKQGYIHLNEVEVFVLDEVDRMLDMGFIPDVKRVLAALPTERQTMFFSATMAPPVLELAQTMVRNPVRVTISPEQLTVDRINQKVLFVRKPNKDALLAALLQDAAITKVIVFTQMKHVANRVVQKLSAAGIDGAAIHGNKSQAARTKALDGFRRGTLRVLVATDVAARGLDVDDVTHVVNYDLPIEAETYVHRIGRTARAGASGEALSFCCAEDGESLRQIERLLRAAIPVDADHPFHCEETLQARKVFVQHASAAGTGRPRQASNRGSHPRGQGHPRRRRSRSTSRP